MKVPVFTILLVCLSASPCLCAQNLATKHHEQIFGLRTAVQYALEHSPSLKAMRRALDISKLNLKNNAFVMLPKFDVASLHTLQQGWPNSYESTKTSNLNITATENLYNNGKDINNYKKSKIQYKATLLQYKQNRDQLIRSVAVGFLDLSLQKKLYEIQKANFNIYQTQYNSALIKYKNGLKTQKDVLRLYSQKRRAQISILQSAEQIMLARSRLLTVLGIKPTANWTNRTSFKMPYLKPIKIKQLPFTPPPLQRQYEYKNFILQGALNSLNVDLARRNFLPQVNVSAGANYGINGQPGFLGAIKSNKKQLDTNLNLEFKYRIFDWGTDSRNILLAKEHGWQTLDNLKQQLLLIQQELTNLMLNIKQHKLSYQISSELKESEQKSYNSVDQLYRNGTVSYLDLINAISDLSAARTQYIADCYTLEKDLYYYYYYQGNIHEKIFN